MSTRCISSQLLSHVLEWRNPQGTEEGWINSPQPIGNIWKLRAKIVTAEVGIILLTAVSLIETVAYAILTLGSLAANPISKKPYHFFASLLQSSSFTILWGCVDAVIYNPFFVNVMTRESFARFWAQCLNPTPIALLRSSDLFEIGRWAQQHAPVPRQILGELLGPIVERGRQINEGADFITNDILNGVSTEKIESVKDMDPGILHLILTKAIALYTIGPKLSDEIPRFFKPMVRAEIIKLRQELASPNAVSIKLIQDINSLEEYSEDPPQEIVTKTYAKLREAAARELQGGILITGCLHKACQEMAEA